jgi:hypothetical protein
LLARRKRAERALTSVVATCYLLGVSTRRMERLVESLGVTSVSKSQVSIMATELDEAVEAFRPRNFYGESRRRCAPGPPSREERIRSQDKTQQDAHACIAGIDVFTHRIEAPVPDVEHQAVSVDLDPNSANECCMFVFDDEILVVGKPVGDIDLRPAIVRSAASCGHDRAHDVVRS